MSLWKHIYVPTTRVILVHEHTHHLPFSSFFHFLCFFPFTCLCLSVCPPIPASSERFPALSFFATCINCVSLCVWMCLCKSEREQRVQSDWKSTDACQRITSLLIPSQFTCSLETPTAAVVLLHLIKLGLKKIHCRNIAVTCRIQYLMFLVF